MDVFGAVVGAIDLVGRLIVYLQAVKGAREDRQKLLSEVSALGALLEVLHGRIGGTNTDDNGGSIQARLVKAGIDRPLRMCCDALDPIVEGLRRLVPTTSTGKSSTLAEKLKDLRWPFRQGEIRTALGTIERLKSLVSLALQTSLMEFIDNAQDELAAVGLTIEEIKSAVSSLEASQRENARKIESVQGDLMTLGNVLQGAADDIAAIQNTVDRNQEGKDRRDVLQWLSAPVFDQRHIAAFEKHASGTGEWFLRHPRFVAWQRGECNVLWCPGNPGVGKSVMASAVIDHLQKGGTKDAAIVYIYFEYTSENYTTRQLIEALLSQFVRQGMSSSNMKSLQTYMASNRPTPEELWAVLEAEVGTYTRVFVVIDALDEADGLTWIPLLDRLRKLPRINILATSRDIGDITAEFEGDCRLDVMADGDDLMKYVEGRLLGSTGSFKRILKANPSLRAEIITGVIEKADGMFLLARLHMNSLETESRVMDLRRALTKLPRDLKSTYDATIGRISDKDKSLALHIFSWVINATRPMTIKELQYALAVEDGMTVIDPDCLHDRATLTSVCVGLVILYESDYKYDDSDQIVGLVHYTTQDYVRDHLSIHLPHPVHLAITCLQYLSFDTFNGPPLNMDSRQKLIRTPLVLYAAHSWGDHARMHYSDSTVHRLAMKLLNDHPSVVKFGSIACRTTNPSALRLCAHFGLKDYLIYLLDNGADVNLPDSEGDTALMAAAVRGWDDILQLLLAQEGVIVNPKGSSGATPLTWAVIRGHQKIVELLLARGDVDVNWRDNDGKTPLAYAAERGYDGIMGLLLAKDNVDMNSRDRTGRTPLALAVLQGHLAVIQMLLARDDVDADCRDKYEMTLLAHAAYGGHNEVMRLLLARDNVNVNSQNREGFTPLAFAIVYSNEAMVQLLLARDDVTLGLKNIDGDTCLAIAAYHNNDRIIKALLDKDATNINSRDLDGRTALSVAAFWGRDAAVKVLLARDGIDINAMDSNGNTPLDSAEESGHQATFELLRVAGAHRGRS